MRMRVLNCGTWTMLCRARLVSRNLSSAAQRCARCCRHSTQDSKTFSLRTHTCGELRQDHVGLTVALYGWSSKPRIQAAQGVAFLPVQDKTGATQFVCELSKWQDVLQSFPKESVVKVGGVVKPRPSEAVNKNMPTGEIEVELQSLETLNEISNSPFTTFGHTESNISVERQLRERPLYLRLPHMQNNMQLRSKVGMAMREALINRHGFLEVETPTLFRKTPEGAQEFIVPTRTKGKFFSLVQSPQQFKQLLMVSGLDRYFQFARCYRDEDQRSDRQPEFTQVDLEMSFVDSDCVIGLTEEVLHSTITSLCPHFSIPNLPFPRMEYRQAMEKYGSDKPDTRYEMTLQNLGCVWEELLREMGIADASEGTPLHPHLYAVQIPQWEQALLDLEHSDKARSKEVAKTMKELSHKYPTAMLQSDKANSDSSLERLLMSHIPGALLGIFSKSSPSLEERLRERVRECVGWQEGDLCVLGSSDERDKDKMLSSLGSWRSVAGSVLHQTQRIALDSTQLDFLWVTDFPLFTVSEGRDGVYHIFSTHHPFTAPVPEHRDWLQGSPSLEQLMKVKGQHYDLVVNGVELGGGSIRIHNSELQEHLLTNILKVSTDQFSHLLKGLKSGCPPHGGIALGFDRLMAVLCQTASLRDVVAFPKSFYGRDLLTGAPSDLSPDSLSLYHLHHNSPHSK